MKDLVCRFWDIPMDQDKRGNVINNSYANYQLFNENGLLINEKEFVEKYFAQNKADIIQALVYLRFKKPETDADEKLNQLL